MKTLPKSALLAALLLPGTAAMAQSVAVFGILDEFLGLTKTGGKSYKRLDSSGLMGSRVGFRGTEDLGDGLKASFMLEHGLNADTGTQADPTRFFNRQTWVGLSGGFGEVRLGRQNSPQFIMSGQYDAFDGATMGSGVNSLSFYLPRFDNSATYTSPQMGPVKLRLLLSLNEANTGRRFGNSVGAVEYQDGPLYLGLNYAETQNAATLAVTKSSFFGGNYEAGALKLFAGYNHAASSNGFFKQDTYSVSASYRVMDKLALLASLSKAKDKTGAQADATHASAGFFYDLSKRTLVYGALAHIGNKNGANFSLDSATALGVVPAPGNSVSGLQLGIRHTF